MPKKNFSGLCWWLFQSYTVGKESKFEAWWILPRLKMETQLSLNDMVGVIIVFL